MWENGEMMPSMANSHAHLLMKMNLSSTTVMVNSPDMIIGPHLIFAIATDKAVISEPNDGNKGHPTQPIVASDAPVEGNIPSPMNPYIVEANAFEVEGVHLEESSSAIVDSAGQSKSSDDVSDGPPPKRFCAHEAKASQLKERGMGKQPDTNLAAPKGRARFLLP